MEKEDFNMKKLFVTAIIFLMMLTLTACVKKNNSDINSAEVKIYYIDASSSKIVTENYTPTETVKEKEVGELLAALKQAPKNVLYKSALPDTVTINEYTFNEDGGLTIDFDAAYNELKGIPEILCRASIVKTLSQVSGVDYIQFNVNGQPLKDSNGEVVLSMTEDEFIESVGDETDYKVSLYFTNENGNALMEHVTNIYYSGTSSLEELVINQLINGPTEIGLYHTIPEGTVLIDVSTKDGICYVDFNEKFLDNTKGINDDVVIYSVVNSLVNLPNINKVQFYINGEIQKTYREKIPFDGFFERNLAIIKDSE
jgi:germination protein M